MSNNTTKIEVNGVNPVSKEERYGTARVYFQYGSHGIYLFWVLHMVYMYIL